MKKLLKAWSIQPIMKKPVDKIKNSLIVQNKKITIKLMSEPEYAEICQIVEITPFNIS